MTARNSSIRYEKYTKHKPKSEAELAKSKEEFYAYAKENGFDERVTDLAWGWGVKNNIITVWEGGDFGYDKEIHLEKVKRWDEIFRKKFHTRHPKIKFDFLYGEAVCILTNIKNEVWEKNQKYFETHFMLPPKSEEFMEKLDILDQFINHCSYLSGREFYMTLKEKYFEEEINQREAEKLTLAREITRLKQEIIGLKKSK